MNNDCSFSAQKGFQTALAQRMMLLLLSRWFRTTINTNARSTPLRLVSLLSHFVFCRDRWLCCFSAFFLGSFFQTRQIVPRGVRTPLAEMVSGIDICPRPTLWFSPLVNILEYYYFYVTAGNHLLTVKLQVMLNRHSFRVLFGVVYRVD